MYQNASQERRRLFATCGNVRLSVLRLTGSGQATADSDMSSFIHSFIHIRLLKTEMTERICTSNRNTRRI